MKRSMTNDDKGLEENEEQHGNKKTNRKSIIDIGCRDDVENLAKKENMKV